MLMTMAIAFFAWPSDVMAQLSQQVALPTDGSYSSEVIPQGALRYQRQLYLITPEEMAESGISANTDFNSIGFTLAAAQNDTTRAGFKLYLENTTDMESRLDLDFSDSISTTNSLLIEALPPGDYEWQVQAVCAGGNSVFTGLQEFSTLDLSGCNRPINLTVDNITSSSATLNWYAPDSPGFSYYRVEYKTFTDANWTAVSPDPTTLSTAISGLDPQTNYQWQVRTFCAADSSQLSSGTFTTLSEDNCSEPASLTATIDSDTSANLTWTAAAGANRYDIRYRRVGTSFWNTTLSFSNSLLLTLGLDPGTTYEWGVRTVCDAGTGAYVSGTNFQTSGTVPCYAPTNPYIDNLSATTATLNWTPTDGATSYNIRYRLKNSISWTNAILPMTQIAITNDSIIVPDSIGAFVVPFDGATTFNYTGQGLYVAFEYQRVAGPLTTLNNALATERNSVEVDENGIESQIVLSLNGYNKTTVTALPEVLIAAKKRPQTTFGSTAFIDSVAVEAVYALGHYSTNFSGDNEVSALISNFADVARTYTVNFNVTGAETYTASQSVTIPAEDTMLVSFTGWLPSVHGLDTLSVSIAGLPMENVLDNNEAFYYTNVNASVHGFADNAKKASSAGFGAGAGLILARHSMNGCGAVNAAQVFIDYSAEGDTLYAVLMDAAGTLIDSSDIFIPTGEEVDAYHSFFFPKRLSFVNEEYYIGLAQVPTVPTKTYYPVGVQWETNYIREDAYYRANIDGTMLVDHPLPGRLMIKAEIVPGGETPVINGDLTLCEGDMNTLTVASANTRYAIRVLKASSEFNDPGLASKQILGIPDIFPGYGLVTGQWINDAPDNPREYVELEFANPSPINFIDIYETLNPGAVDTVYVKDPGTGNFVMVYSATASPGQQIATKNHITFPLTSFDVSEVRIAMASDSVMGYNGIDAVGIGEEVAPSFTSYAWSNGDSGSSTSVDMAGTYAVTVTDAGGCVNSTSVVVTSPDEITPTISILVGSASFCEGSSVTLSSDQQSNIVWSTGEMTPNITVSTSGSYTVEYDDGTGCGAKPSDPIVVTVNSLPTVSITGDLAICDGGSTTLDAGAGFASYSWSNSATSQTINVNTVDTYTVFVTDANGCSNSTEVTTFEGAPPSPVISGSLSFCQGASTNLDAGAGYASYNWSTGAMTQTIPVNTEGVFSVTVTTSAGCTGSVSTSTVINPLPTPTITGDTGFCPGETANLDAGAGYANYNWFNGSSSQSVAVNAAGTYGVTVTDGNGCTGSDSQIVSAFTPPMPPIISGGLSFCGGNTTVLDAGENLSAYLWSTGETTNTIVVGTVGTFSVTVTDNNGCTGIDQVTTTLDGELPAIPGPVTGPSMGLCGATNLTYSIAPVPNTDFYVWTVPDGMTITSGQGTTSITVDAIPNFTSGIIVPKANNSCGQSPTFGQSFLLVQGYPDIPGTPQGPTEIACQSANIYTIDPVAGADSYIWTVPPGAAVVLGQGTNTAYVKFYSFSGSGDICVDAVNSCGVSLCCFDNCITVTCSDIIDLAEPGETQSETFSEYIQKDGVELIENLGVYPNPNNGQFRMEGYLPEEGNFELTVFSTLGDMVHFEPRGHKNAGLLKEDIALPDLSDGTYILKIKVGKTIWNKKVVIMR